LDATFRRLDHYYDGFGSTYIEDAGERYRK